MGVKGSRVPRDSKLILGHGVLCSSLNLRITYLQVTVIALSVYVCLWPVCSITVRSKVFDHALCAMQLRF